MRAAIGCDFIGAESWWMLMMKIGGVLILLGHREKVAFIEQPADEANAGWCSGLRKTIRNDNAGIPGKIAQQQASALEGRRNEQVHLLEQSSHLLNQQISDALRLEVFDRRNEAPPAKCVWPCAAVLVLHQFVATTSRQVIESSRRFGRKQKGNIALRITRKLDRYQARTESPEHQQRGFVIFLALVLLFLEIRSQIPDSQPVPFYSGIVTEWNVVQGLIDSVRSLDRVEHNRAIFDRPGNRTDLVHAPAQSHSACTAHAAVTRPQTGDPAPIAWRDD